jgi:hypothetical protein
MKWSLFIQKDDPRYGETIEAKRRRMIEEAKRLGIKPFVPRVPKKITTWQWVKLYIAIIVFFWLWMYLVENLFQHYPGVG